MFQIERIFKNLDGSPQSHQIVHGISSLSPKKASPRRLLELVRGHWKIESLHWVRDMIYDEDRSQIRKGQAPQLMATFRNVAISLLRFAGASGIASSVRHCARNLATVLGLMGIPQT